MRDRSSPVAGGGLVRTTRTEKANFFNVLPCWKGTSLSWNATCLGFHIGPEVADSVWGKPLAKFSKIARHWASLGHVFPEPPRVPHLSCFSHNLLAAAPSSSCRAPM